MKRDDIVQIIADVLNDTTSWPSDRSIARRILQKIEDAGMQPPKVDEETAQALAAVYVYPHYYQWDEDVEQIEAVQDMKKRRAEVKQRRLQDKIDKINALGGLPHGQDDGRDKKE